MDYMKEKDLEEYTTDMARIGWLAAHVEWNKEIPDCKRKKLREYCRKKFEKRVADYNRHINGVHCPKKWDYRSWRHFNEVMKRCQS